MSTVEWVFGAVQLLGAGAALGLGVGQLTTWARASGERSEKWLSVSALLLAVMLVSNAAVLLGTSERIIDTAMWIRAAALSGLAVCALPLAATLTGRSVPRPVLLPVSGLAALRVGLWGTTDVLYRGVVGGAPGYGPLLPVVNLPLMAGVLGYLLYAGGRWGRPIEHRILSVGVAGTVALGILTLLTLDPVTRDVVTGLLAVPAIVGVYVIVVRRETLARRAALVPSGSASAGDAGRMRLGVTHDELTSLPNRALVRDNLTQALARTATGARRVAAIVLDLDRFTSINAVHGHPAGDRVIAQIAERLRRAARGGHTVGRFEGDAFVVVVEDVADEVEPVATARRLLATLDRPIWCGATALRLSASVGIALGDHLDAADDLLRDAETAMNRAKERGGATIDVFDPDLRADLLRHVEFQGALGGAVVRREICVHYQPIVELETGRVVGAEALARWQRGGRLVPPAEWIPLAEEVGAIDAIGCEVLRLASTEARRCVAAGHDAFLMAVNISPLQLTTGYLLDALETVLTQGLRPDQLCLEVTETAIVDAGRGVNTLRAIAGLGVRIALDDFGVGYSSLEALVRLPLHAVKIDRIFTARVTDRDGAAVVSAAITLARELGLDVVAEGIETTAQRDALLSLGCELGQGFLLGHPQPGVDLR